MSARDWLSAAQQNPSRKMLQQCDIQARAVQLGAGESASP